MSSLEQRIASVTEKRLAVIAATAANLKARMHQLEELRDQIRKAQLSASESKSTNMGGSKERGAAPNSLASCYGLSSFLLPPIP
jgi:hypothetical protein